MGELLNNIAWMNAYATNGVKSNTRVMMALWTYADNDTLICWPTIEQLAEDSGLSERQVVTQLNSNVENGWLRRDNRGGRGKATTYTLTFPVAKSGVAQDLDCTSLPERVQSATERVKSTSEKGEADCTPTTHVTTQLTTHVTTQRAREGCENRITLNQALEEGLEKAVEQKSAETNVGEFEILSDLSSRSKGAGDRTLAEWIQLLDALETEPVPV